MIFETSSSCWLYFKQDVLLKSCQFKKTCSEKSENIFKKFKSWNFVQGIIIKFITDPSPPLPNDFDILTGSLEIESLSLISTRWIWSLFTTRSLHRSSTFLLVSQIRCGLYVFMEMDVHRTRPSPGTLSRLEKKIGSDCGWSKKLDRRLSIVAIIWFSRLPSTFVLSRKGWVRFFHWERKRRGKAYLRCTQPTSLLIN